jgi:hypothetical protein
VGRVALDHGPAAVALPLPPPFHHSAPNVIGLQYGYRRHTRGGETGYRIGTTGVESPGDLHVASAGQTYGSAGTIRLDGADLSPDRRGYNLVALDAAGRVVKAEAFDTFLEDDASPRLAAWIASLPTGTIVAGAVRDDGSGRLAGAAVDALRLIGVAGDLRGRFREAHAFVGVKGARPGSALEALGPRPVALTIGTPAASEFELSAFALTPAEASGYTIRSAAAPLFRPPADARRRFQAAPACPLACACDGDADAETLVLVCRAEMNESS